MLKNFRGHIVDVSIPSSIEPHFDGADFTSRECEVPTSFDYKIDDLLAVGKVSPVSTEILHDQYAVDDLINASAESAAESSVESSNAESDAVSSVEYSNN